MALHMWAALGGMVHLAAGRLPAARATTESAPPPEPMKGFAAVVSIVTVAEVAVRTDDRVLLQQMLIEARDAYDTGSPSVRRAAAGVLALAAWQRGDVHDAVRWLGGDVTLLVTPMGPQVLDQAILSARVATAAGDAGLRARVLDAVDLLERDRPGVALFAAVAQHARGLLERDADALVAAENSLRSSRPLLCACAAEDAGRELARTQRTTEALDRLNAAFDSYMDCGAVADARRAARELRLLGVGRRIVARPRARTGLGSLSDSELKVVHLIAEGATNRTVAQQLHLSPHTVKTHVRHAFAKLGISSRVELTQLIRGSG